jgi:protein involved in polysaccharide export with SLBB domain
MAAFTSPKTYPQGWLHTRQAHACIALTLASCCALFTGCAALTNPIANGVPVRLLPDELLAESREGFEPISLTLLRQPPPEKYVLAPGDTLGIYIEGVLGSAETPPPVNIPETTDLPPSVGYPFPVRDDGTVSMPYVEPVRVAGMTIEEAEKAVVDAYLQKEILRPEDRRILVTLMRPRHIRVMVIREDSQQRQVTLQTESLIGLGTSRTQIGGAREGTGMVLELPAYQNDVLNALTRTGGLPGLESTQEVIVQRGYWDGASDSMAGMHGYPSQADITDRGEGINEKRRRIIRIPIQTRGGELLPFRPEDIILQSGDIVLVQAREPEFYYTGGLLPADEVPLPNDYDLTVVEAVLKVRGPLLNGGLNASNLNGAVIQAGVGNPSPSLLSVLRETPGGGQVTIRVDLNEAVRDPRENLLVQAGDVLILQETPDEAVTRYFTQVFQINLFTRFLNRNDAQGSASIVVP